MWKKFLISFSIVILLLIGITAFNIYYKKDDNKKENENIVQNEIELSSQYVTDACINEWEDYSLTVQEEIREASQNISDEDKTYIAKAEDDYIKIYYINNKNKKILYKVTDITIQYLGKEDVEKLNKGIQVKGLQELNQLLEDFE